MSRWSNTLPCSRYVHAPFSDHFSAPTRRAYSVTTSNHRGRWWGLVLTGDRPRSTPDAPCHPTRPCHRRAPRAPELPGRPPGRDVRHAGRFQLVSEVAGHLTTGRQITILRIVTFRTRFVPRMVAAGCGTGNPPADRQHPATRPRAGSGQADPVGPGPAGDGGQQDLGVRMPGLAACRSRSAPPLGRGTSRPLGPRRSPRPRGRASRTGRVSS